MNTFPNLLRPGRIGQMELRNRLVMSPMKTMYGSPDGLPSGGTPRELAADSVIIAGQPEADTVLFDALTDRLPGTKVHAVGDCTGLGLIRKATEDGARAACSI